MYSASVPIMAVLEKDINYKAYWEFINNKAVISSGPLLPLVHFSPVSPY